MEEFKVIPFEDNYEVSNKGRVRNRNTLLVKSLRYNKCGYLRVTLYPSGKTYTAHQLVGKVWLWESYREGLQIDHLDAVRDNNDVTNLEWVTQEENQRRIRDRGCHKGEVNGMATITDAVAKDIKYSFQETISDLVERLGVSRNIIETIRRRERWTHVIDKCLEGKYLKGELEYPRGKTANLSAMVSKELEIDILSEKYTTKDLTIKYNVSKSAICRRKRKLGL